MLCSHRICMASVFILTCIKYPCEFKWHLQGFTDLNGKGGRWIPTPQVTSLALKHSKSGGTKSPTANCPHVPVCNMAQQERGPEGRIHNMPSWASGCQKQLLVEGLIWDVMGGPAPCTCGSQGCQEQRLQCSRCMAKPGQTARLSL